MTLNQLLQEQAPTAVLIMTKKSWNNKEDTVVSFKFNGVLYDHLMFQNKGQVKSRFYPTTQQLLDNDWFITKSDEQTQANYAHRFFKYQLAYEKQQGLVAKAKVKPLKVANQDVPDVAKAPKKVKKNKGVQTPNQKRKARTKRPTPFIGCHVHYPFGPTAKNDSIQATRITMRAGFSPSAIMPTGIQKLDFEFNDIGLINGRFYLDDIIKSRGYKHRIYFSNADFNFIKEFGPTAYIQATNYKSNFDYELVADEIIKSHLNLDESHTIIESYPKGIIRDHKIQDFDSILVHEFQGLTQY